MKINFYTAVQPDDHREHMNALANGLKTVHGLEVEVLPLTEAYVPCDVAVVFGVGKRAVSASWPRAAVIFDHYHRQKKPVLVMERGYVQREEYYSLGFNGLNGMAIPFPDDKPSGRWDALGVEMKPWRSEGEHILVCGQVPWDATVQHTDHPAWCQNVVRRCEILSDRPVVFRPHPAAPDQTHGLSASTRTFEEDLAEAHAVVTYNSTTSSLAVLEGVPVIVADRGSMAWDVAEHKLTAESLEKPAKPDRDQWAYNLAYRQWTLDEMNEGAPWPTLAALLST